MKTILIKDMLRFGWEKTKTNFSEVFTVLLILLFLNLAMSFLNKAIDHSNIPLDLFIYVITMIGFLVLSLIFSINVIKQGLIIVRGGKANPSTLLEFPDVFVKYLLGQIAVGIIITVGFIFLIVPGIIAALILCFTKPILVDLKLSPIEALKKGRDMTKGYIGSLFLFFLVIVLFNILGALVLGIGLLVTLPTSFFAFLHLYDQFLLRLAKPQTPEIRA